MENFGVNLSKVKQPKPDLADSGSKRVIQNPHVGVISDINPTTTPLTDTLIIKERENPRAKFIPLMNGNKSVDFNNFATGGIIACGLLALLSLIKRK